MVRLLQASWALRLYRAGVLVALVWLVHAQARWMEAQRGAVISLRQAQRYFPKADRVQLRDPERGLHVVLDARGNSLGALLKTAPFTDNIIGYSGPSDVLIALDTRGVVAGVELLRSGDTPEHVQKVRRAAGFLKRFVGWNPSEEPPPKVEGVSGATLTSSSIAESIEQRLAGAAPSLRFPDPLALSEVQGLFTNATRMSPDQAAWKVFDREGRLLGLALRTSPQADNVSGYRGPTDCLVALDPSGKKVTGVQLRRSFDTESYVDQVRRAKPFLDQFVGRSVEDLASFHYPRERVEGVSGATMTARAAAEGIRRRMAAELKAAPRKSWRLQARDLGLATVILAALVLAFTPIRGKGWVRLAWQVVLVGYVGLVNHDLLSLALLGGWTVHGWAVKASPSLLLLAGVALGVPWVTRRQVYCHQICAHGAAQQLLGAAGSKLFRRGTPLGKRSGRSIKWRKTAARLELLPGLLLALALATLLLGWNFSLAKLEAFDAWVWTAASGAAITIAVVGLVASLFVPQAYCRYGCPTGALLRFLRSAGSADRWGARDSIALLFVAASGLMVLAARAWPSRPAEVPPLEMHGRTMGTTWSVKIRDEVADPPAVEKLVVREFEWAESMTSNWRPNTDLSEFNRTLTTNAFPVPWPVVTLARWGAEISAASGGAYDLTVGPLVRLWGFGPNPRPSPPPSEAELTAVRPAVGWQKLEILDGMIRKKHPSLQVDLSSIAKGWGIDQVVQVLERRGYTNVLVEAGGELRARGHWKVAIEHPARTTVLADEALASSGVYRQNFKVDGHQYSHLIDPITGRPISHHTVSVSVRHPDCAHADAWATAFNVLGVEKGMPLAERLHLAVQFVIALPSRQLEVRQSSAWTERAGELSRDPSLK